jgi:hypothetical protein
MLIAGTLAAQTHDNKTEKTASGEMKLASSLRVGTETLPAGDYRVVCDRVHITFSRTDGTKVLELPCKGKELAAKSVTTNTVISVNPAGVRSLLKLTLAGSNVEHVFD